MKSADDVSATIHRRTNGAGMLPVSSTLDLPEEVITESNAILGKKGSGKTSSGVVLYEEIYRAGVPVVAVDPKGDWYGIRSSADGEHKGLPVPVFGGLHGDIPLEATGGKALATLIREQHMSCILDVSEFSAAERRRFLTPFADQLYRVDDRTPMHLLLEEAHEYIPQRVDAGDAAMVGVFERLVKNGRFKGIGVTMLSQRSASLNKNVLTQVDNLFVMRTTSPQDRTAVGDWIKYQEGASEILQSMSSLSSGECWLYQPNRGEPVRFQFRLRTTFDAGETPKIGEVRTQPTNLADVDLSAIAAAMAETIEKAKADDPAELRKRVALLERDLASAKRTIADLDAREPVAETVEVPILTDDARQFLASQANLLHQSVLDLIRQVAEGVGSSADKLTALANPGDSPAAPRPAPVKERQAAVKPMTAFASATQPPQPPRAPIPVDAEGANLSGMMRAILTVLAQHGQSSRARIGAYSGKAHGGGAFVSAMATLQRSGYIEGANGQYTITDAGFDALGSYEKLPTGDALIELWVGKFKPMERAIFETLLAAWPEGLTRAEIGQKSGRSAAGGAFVSAIAKLKRVELVETFGQENWVADHIAQAAGRA